MHPTDPLLERFRGAMTEGMTAWEKLARAYLALKRAFAKCRAILGNYLAGLAAPHAPGAAGEGEVPDA
jgi:hypothetical protein